MRILAPLDCAAYAELLDLCRIDRDRPQGEFAPNGSFVRETRNDEADLYWYYRGYTRRSDQAAGKSTKRYVGRVGDPVIEASVAAHAATKASYLARRQLVSRLKRAGLPAPHPTEGAIAKALSEAGLLSCGAIVVGSVAFQTYGGLLGIRPHDQYYRTLDLDLAHPRGLAIPTRGGEPTDILAALRGVDPTFTPIHLSDVPNLIAGYRNAANFRLEFLTPPKADRRGSSRLTALAGLKGIGAQPLRFLEFSLENTVDAVLLHEAGILVSVPQPARFAVHKLIVAAIRTLEPSDNAAKSRKDVLQAEAIIDGLMHGRDALALGVAWLDAWHRGPKWRRALRDGTLRLSPDRLAMLMDAAGEAAELVDKASPFDADRDPRQALLGGEKRARMPA